MHKDEFLFWVMILMALFTAYLVVWGEV